ncbi:MAG TPA: hypothetical protein VFX86_02175 [Candidatus Saccharimonadales bacterium]|nr:hypothetical protein [Candidatus Saccharimonadales bacterium]
MTATNHALSGALIGLGITQPAVALPLAFVSHFVLDAIPHFGIRFYQSPKKRRFFHIYLVIDAFLLAVIMTALYFAGAGWLVFVCLFLAGCPDFVQAYKYLFMEDFRRKPTHLHWFTRFHKGIQRSETEKGILVEVPLAIIFATAIYFLL